MCGCRACTHRRGDRRRDARSAVSARHRRRDASSKRQRRLQRRRRSCCARRRAPHAARPADWLLAGTHVGLCACGVHRVLAHSHRGVPRAGLGPRFSRASGAALPAAALAFCRACLLLRLPSAMLAFCRACLLPCLPSAALAGLVCGCLCRGRYDIIIIGLVCPRRITPVIILLYSRSSSPALLAMRGMHVSQYQVFEWNLPVRACGVTLHKLAALRNTTHHLTRRACKTSRHLSSYAHALACL